MSQPQPPITRRDILTMPRLEALMLGVNGHDTTANAARFAIARHIHEEQKQYDAAGYARAAEQGTTVDPDPIRPFGLDALLRARGNVQAVVEAPDFTDSVLRDMGCGWREEIVSDEDGTRWETFPPTPAEEAEAAYQAALIHEELADCGVVASHPTADAPVHDALINQRLSDIEHASDLIQYRIETRELLNDLIGQHRGDELAHALQAHRFVPTSARSSIYARFDAPLPVPRSYPRRGLRDPIEAADELIRELIDITVERVAQNVPAGELIADFPGSVDSRYSSTWKISLGSREPDVDADQADIDGDLDATWHFSSHEFTRIVDSHLRLDAPIHQVAAWIIDQARQADSPRQSSWDARIRAFDPFSPNSGPTPKPTSPERSKPALTRHEPPPASPRDFGPRGPSII